MLAWETTIEDIRNVMRKHHRPVSFADASAIHDRLDHEEITKAALMGDHLDEQTDYAYGVIEEQLQAMGIIPGGRTL